MKTKLILLLLIPLWGFGQQWSQIDDFPGLKRDDGVAFTIGGGAYCGTGLDLGFNHTADFYRFDFGTETWSQSASLPDSCRRQYATSFSYDDEGYLFGGVGANGTYFNDLWKYSSATDSWMHLSNLPDAGRSGSSCFVIEDTVYVVGGGNGVSPALSEVWAYAILSGTWTEKASMPVTMWRGMAWSYGGEGYMGLGLDYNYFANPDFYRYDPVQDSWVLVPQLSLTPRVYPSYSQIGDKVYVYGGLALSTSLNTLERINMASLTVDPLVDLPTFHRRGAMAFTNSQDFFITCGVGPTERVKETWVARGVLSVDEFAVGSAVHVRQLGQVLDVGNQEFPIENVSLYSINGDECNVKIINESQVDISSLTSGVYWYAIGLGSTTARGKIFLQF